MVAAPSSSLLSTSRAIHTRSSGSFRINFQGPKRNSTSAKTARRRHLGAHRHHPYSGAVPHGPPLADLERTEQRMRLATLRKLHVALDIRDELEQREKREVAALAELGVGVAALCESLDALERRIQALHPEWPGFTPHLASSGREIKVKEEDASGSGCADHDSKHANSSTGTTPILGSPLQSPSTPRALLAAPMSAVAVSPSRNCLALRPATPNLAVSSPLAVGRSL